MNRVRQYFVVIAVMLLAGCASPKLAKDTESKEQSLVVTNVRLASVYLQRGRLDMAIERIEKALDLDSSDSDANYVMGLVQWKLKKIDQAEKYFSRAVKERPDNADAQNIFGAFLCEQGRVKEATARFDIAIDNPLYNTPEQANINAGLCLVKVKSYSMADRYFRAALDINPWLSKALFHRAKFKYRKKKYLSARAFIDRYFESIDKESPQSLLLAIRIERALRAKNAEASYRLRLKGKFPEFYKKQRL